MNTTESANLPQVKSNGVMIVHGEHNTFGIATDEIAPRMLKLEVDYMGKRIKEDFFCSTQWYRDCLVVDIRLCMIRVLDGDKLLASLGNQPQGALYQPWMVWQGDQAYITENYVSIPPALRIVDETGALWTLGFSIEPKDQSPDGEFAFQVLRNGLNAGAIASRIERRNGQIRVFTKHGWKRWLGREFS